MYLGIIDILYSELRSKSKIHENVIEHVLNYFLYNYVMNTRHVDSHLYHVVKYLTNICELSNRLCDSLIVVISNDSYLQGFRAIEISCSFK